MHHFSLPKYFFDTRLASLCSRTREHHATEPRGHVDSRARPWRWNWQIVLNIIGSDSWRKLELFQCLKLKLCWIFSNAPYSRAGASSPFASSCNLHIAIPFHFSCFFRWRCSPLGGFSTVFNFHFDACHSLLLFCSFVGLFLVFFTGW